MDDPPNSDISPPLPPVNATLPPSLTALAPAGRAVWLEVAAVLAVGVVPHLASAVVNLCDPAPPLPLWLDAFHFIVISGCTILVTLYLIARSGETWGHFGLSRPRVLDAPLGALLLVVAAAVWYLLPVLPDLGTRAHTASPRPHGPVEAVLVVVKNSLSAFSEELVTRAYLVTRLTILLRSRGEAVLCAAIAFASYHAYQGPTGVAYALAMGVVYGTAFLTLGRVWPLVIGHTLYNSCLDLLG